ncbi:hypothetical protein RN001_005057 [Aquatica leii]|uniref:Sec16 Sec23-binding domain-containing protein n=1 Tax=Aquatica leii TaxID=1421715 RepID=A0AAN7PCC3_9COLE|nr:hypothetical protein RN001_005057 [Aquatica leii]
MSWIKRRGQTTSPNPPSAPPVRMYNPNQHSNLQGQWQQQDLQPPSSNSWYSQPQPAPHNLQQNHPQTQQEASYWNQSYNQQQTAQTNPISNYNEQYSQYTPVGYSNENNSYHQKNYINQQSQNHVYNYEERSNHPDSQSNTDSWNWGWVDEDNSNVQSVSQPNLNVNASAVNFATNEETWNWSVDDPNTNSNSKHSLETQVNSPNSYQNIQNASSSQANVFSQMGKLAEKHNTTNEISSLDSLEDSNNIPTASEVLTSIPKHGKADHLTPQWSTESQMSQDSSDLLHTSESDKSHMLSRSSTISESPVSGQDINAENIMPRQEIYGTHSSETSVDHHSYYRQDNYNLQENKEDISNLRSDLKQLKSNPTSPPLPPKNQTPPLGPTAADDLKNPYKLNAGLTHKNVHKYNSESKTVSNYSTLQMKYPMSQSPFVQSVNLETLPDNSEQPDTIPQAFRNNLVKTTSQQWPENNEAPINDRNQYLETGQLSNNEFNQSQIADSSDSLPPPGFTRMVLGQIEQADSNLGNQDEPPPGLSRMVLGETGSSSVLLKSDEPLHRMIPGGSSSPKPMSRYQTTNYQLPKYGDNNGSESETSTSIANQIRSATIGADTQPVATSLSGTSVGVINRSKTIGADIPLPYNSSNSENVKTNSHAHGAPSNFNHKVRETNVDGANNLDEKITQPVNTRRDSIEGEPQENSLSNLVNSIRDLTVGENLNSNSNPTLAVPERSARRSSKQESTDSDCEPENVHLTRERKDRRYYDKHDDYERDKGRSRYSPSPDHYREKKYERMRYRDKRYEDETDYYSDKERGKRRDDRDRREEIDRKYSSLKRDKEKERRRKEPRGHRDYGREGRREYYHRYDEEYDDPSRSRPSSRSDSMHDSYRQERDRHRDRERQRRHRDPYNPYAQGYGYEPYNQYYQQYQYQYFENLCRTNPQAYAEWYRKYYQQANSQQGYGNEDRASVHSGRSSANDELVKDRCTRQSYYSQTSSNYYREPHNHSTLGHYAPEDTRNYDQTDSSLYLEEATAASQRLTPAKFASAHVKASISSGRIVKVLPNYPLDGQSALVEVANLRDLLTNDSEYKELVEFPGPLTRGVTHKKTIIEYCENKIRNAIYSKDIGDVDSYILMWELLILLLRQNGMVVGTDIAELLMKDKKQEGCRKDSITSNSSGVAEPSPLADAGNNSLDTHSSTCLLKEDVVTNKFREFLLYGSEKEALEWAMKHGLWGHALFLASKLDKRTYANVMTRFANGLTMNDPLQTLYQLLSGKVPAAVTCVADEKWGDWRPHLAMILSNTTQRPELDRKAITTLGDTLFNRGSVYAAQFCYLMAQVGFSRFGTESAKLVLLGANHNKPFIEFAINEAIHMTEVYEYACSLNDPNFVIPEFLAYKYLLATRLADNGLLEKALTYLEKISLAILHNSSVAQQSLIRQVTVLADRLKYYDLVDDSLEGENNLIDNRPDSSWLKELKEVEKDFNSGLINQDNLENFKDNNLETEQNQISQSAMYDQSSWPQQNVQQYQQAWQSSQYTQQNLDYQHQQNQGSESYGTEVNKDQQNYWPNQQLVENVEQIGVDSSSQYVPNDISAQTDYWNNASAQDLHQPQISLPNQSKEHSAFEESRKEEIHNQVTKKDSPIKHKPQEKPATAGWFGGIWNKLSLRPKNQMKLPDDKNPTIVWDEQKKRWINLDGEGDGAAAELKPPPKMSDMYPAPKPSLPVPQDNFHNAANAMPRAYDPPTINQNHAMIPNQNPLANSNVHNQQVSNFEQALPNEDQTFQSKSVQPNMFKLQRGRNIKKSYVDVFNPGAKASGGAGSLPAPDTFATLPNNGLQTNYFVPAPITDLNAPTDFLTPAPMQQHEDNAQH